MNEESIRKAVELAKTLGFVLVATADEKGTPHVAVAGEMTYLGKNRIAVGAWFCPTTLNNLLANRSLAAVVWDRTKDLGYQLIGESESMESLAMMDGYTPAEGGHGAVPQVERRVIVRVSRVIDFMHALHSDT